eukprot:gene12754-17100_t
MTIGLNYLIFEIFVLNCLLSHFANSYNSTHVVVSSNDLKQSKQIKQTNAINVNMASPYNASSVDSFHSNNYFTWLAKFNTNKNNNNQDISSKNRIGSNFHYSIKRGKAKLGKGLTSTTPVVWAGKPITLAERESIETIRLRLDELSPSVVAAMSRSKWLSEVNDVELLRFLRAKGGNVEDAWKSIINHAHWRSSKYGAESEFTKTAFENSPLNNEVFWLGVGKSGCPILVIRTQVHDGYYYNEDPRIFASFFVHVIEQGRELYGVGIDKEVCVLIDRGGTVYRNGQKKQEKRDFNVIPNLVELVRHLYSTIVDNYPEVLQTAHIAPASWFFSMCYKVTSRVMDPKSRERFKMVKAKDVRDLHRNINPMFLPAHLDGTSNTYTSVLNIIFDPSESAFPIQGKKGYEYSNKPSDYAPDSDQSSDVAPSPTPYTMPTRVPSHTNYNPDNLKVTEQSTTMSSRVMDLARKSFQIISSKFSKKYSTDARRDDTCTADESPYINKRPLLQLAKSLMQQTVIVPFEKVSRFSKRKMNEAMNKRNLRQNLKGLSEVEKAAVIALRPSNVINNSNSYNHNHNIISKTIQHRKVKVDSSSVILTSDRDMNSGVKQSEE